MNSRTKNVDDHELPPSAARVSARSRFSAPPAAVFSQQQHDYGNNTNKSKGGINGRHDSSDEDEMGLSSRSARRTAARRSSSNSSSASAPTSSGAVTKSKELGLSSQRSASSAATASSKDRPWRTASSGTSAATSSTSYVTASSNNNTTSDAIDYSSDYELGSRNRSADSASSVEVTTPTRNRWAQYETEDLEEESRKATSNAVVDMATRLADRQVEESVQVHEDQVEKIPIIEVTKDPMGGAPGTGYRDDPWQSSKHQGDLEALESNGNSLPPVMPNRNRNSDDATVKLSNSSNSKTSSTKDYVKSRLSSLVPHRNRKDVDYERGIGQSNSPTKPSDHDKVRNEALMMLQIADNCLQDSPRNSCPTSPRSTPRNSFSGNTTGMFRTSTGGLSVRELHENEVQKIKVSQQAGQGSTEGGGHGKREKASSIAGIDGFGKSEKGAKFFDGTFTIGSHDEEDLKKNNSLDPASSSPNDEKATSSWSSRYSVERQLMAITGGLDSTHMLAKMDVLHSSREKTKSARGLYRASGYAMDGSHEEYNDYTTSSSTSGVGLGGMWMWLRGTLWSDDLELNYDGTTQSLVRREKAMQRRKRFRWMALFFVGLSIAIGVCVHMIQNPRVAAGAAMSSGGEGSVDFYVLADEPYDFSNVGQLTRDLEALPANADFVIHLGNANGDEQSQCQEYGFERAAAILKESPVPVLVIPGDLDWAACGSKSKAQRALEYWDINLGRFEKHWDHRFDVDYSEDVVGNFAFLHKNVLFMSVSIVDAETEPNEVTARLEQNVMWTKAQLTEFKPAEYHAVVIFGHAPPSSKQVEYFLPVMDQIKDLNKPVLYLHANSEGSFEQYTPFTQAENFKAVQLEKQGREAPMRVVVNGVRDDDGEVFVFERREPAMERIEKP